MGLIKIIIKSESTKRAKYHYNARQNLVLQEKKKSQNIQLSCKNYLFRPVSDTYTSNNLHGDYCNENEKPTQVHNIIIHTSLLPIRFTSVCRHRTCIHRHTSG